MKTENNTIDQKAIEEIKQDLLSRKKQILEDLKDIAREDDHEADGVTAKFPEYGDKPDENAQEIAEYSTNLATEHLMEKTLRDIESALKRIEDGSYGMCKYCNEPIDTKRLKARPVASACVPCKTKLQNQT